MQKMRMLSVNCKSATVPKAKVECKHSLRVVKLCGLTFNRSCILHGNNICSLQEPYPRPAVPTCGSGVKYTR